MQGSRAIDDAVPEPLLGRLFEELLESGIRYCVLRDAERLDALSRGGEVDLLVDPEQLPRLRGLLGELGFVEQPAWGHAPHRFFVAYDPALDAWLVLDVVDAIAFGAPVRALRTGLGAACLARRRRQGGVCVPAPEDEFVTLLLHCVLDKGRFDPERRERLRRLCSEVADESYLCMLLEAYWSPATTRAHMAELMRGEDWTALLAQRQALERRLARPDRLGSFTRRVAARILRKLNRWLRPGARRAPSLALLAPDGAGKSTLAALLRETIPLPLRTLYMGLYPSQEAPARLPGLGFLRRLLRQHGRWWLARWHQAQGRFVVFDRYGFDALLESPTRGAWHRRLRRFLLAHSCPPPDLVVLLDAPGEVLYARKGEHDPVALERQRRGYRRLLDRLPRAALVDATRPLESVRREVTALLWNAYRAGRATP